MINKQPINVEIADFQITNRNGINGLMCNTPNFVANYKKNPNQDQWETNMAQTYDSLNQRYNNRGMYGSFSLPTSNNGTNLPVDKESFENNENSCSNMIERIQQNNIDYKTLILIIIIAIICFVGIGISVNYCYKNNKPCMNIGRF